MARGGIEVTSPGDRLKEAEAEVANARGGAAVITERPRDTGECRKMWVEQREKLTEGGKGGRPSPMEGRGGHTARRLP